MSEVMLIVQREFLERVRSRVYVLGTLLFPVFVAVTILLPLWFERGGSDDVAVAIVDETGGELGRAIAVNLAAAEEENPERFAVETRTGPATPARAALDARLSEKSLDAYLVVPADVLERNEIVLRGRGGLGFGVRAELRAAASRAVQAARLEESGIEPGALAAMLKPVEVEETRVTSSGEGSSDSPTAFVLTYVLAFLIYFMVVFYGNAVMRSVLEEKTNRIVEVMVSSVRASDLMLGKIVGVCAAALLQVAIWVGLAAIAIGRSGSIAERLSLPADALDALRVPPMLLVALVAFFVLGFFVYSSLFAALGAAVTTEQEAQSLQFMVIFPLILPMVFLGPITSDPAGTLATALAIVPLTAPLVMPMRMAVTAVPPLELAASLVLLLLSIGAVAWGAGKVYRVGILATGKKPTLRELGRWLRAA